MHELVDGPLPGGLERESLREQVRRLEASLAAEEAAHARTRLSFAQLESILDHAPLAIYLKDAAHQYALVNCQYERLSAQPRAAILGRDDFAIFPEPVAALFRSQDEEVTRVGKPVEFKETIPLADGVHTFITSKFPVLMGPGGALGVAGVCTEVTALEAARSQLEQAQAELVSRERLAALGELSAVIAHEVRNPLGVIFNALATLRRLPHAGGDTDELMGIIGEESARLNRMVGALLELVRPILAKPLPTALEPLLSGAIEAAVGIHDAPAEVKLVVAPGLTSVIVDPDLVRLAVINLVTNALHTPGRRGPVKVHAASGANERLVVAVIDDGAGVAPELEQRIFEPFFTTRASGTGLGLAVVKRVALAHHGTVRLLGTPGGGATFELSVPLQPT